MIHSATRRGLQGLIKSLYSNKVIPDEKAAQIFHHKFLETRDAVQVFQRIRDTKQTNTNNYYDYLSFVAKKGESELVYDGFKTAISDEVHPKKRWVGILMQLHAARKDLKETIKTISNSIGFMRKHAAEFYFCVTQLGTSKEALDQFADLWKQVGRPDIYISFALIDGYNAIGKYQDALDWVNRIKQSGLTLDSSIYSSMICAAFKRGDEADAMSWLEEMEKNGIHANFLASTDLINAAIEKGDMDGVKRRIAKMKAYGLTLNSATITTLIEAAAKQGDTEMMEHWMEEMKKLGLKPTLPSFSAMIHAAAKRGDDKTVWYWLEEQQKHDLHPNIITYAALVEAAANKGDAKKVNYWFDEMRRESIKPDVMIYSALIGAAAKRGDYLGVQKWVEAMKKNRVRPNDFTFQKLKEGKLDSAYWVAQLQLI